MLLVNISRQKCISAADRFNDKTTCLPLAGWATLATAVQKVYREGRNGLFFSQYSPLWAAQKNSACVRGVDIGECQKIEGAEYSTVEIYLIFLSENQRSCEASACEFLSEKNSIRVSNFTCRWNRLTSVWHCAASTAERIYWHYPAQSTVVRGHHIHTHTCTHKLPL